MENESIYKKIIRLSDGNSLPYTFQDIYNAGRYDINMVMFGDDIPVNFQESCAFDLIEMILECLESMQVSDEISKFLDANPLFKYSSKVFVRLDLFISESLVDEEKLYKFAFYLATGSRSIAEVKLGILMLGLFQNEITENVIKKLGLYSEYTLYSIETTINWKNRNSFIFELAKNTSGYGKVISTYFLKPVTPEIKNWMLLTGTINEVMPNISAALCLRKLDMLNFLLKEPVCEKSFAALSTLYGYAFEKNDTKQFLASIKLVNDYLDAAKTLAKSFMDFFTVLAIYNNMNVTCEVKKISKAEAGIKLEHKTELKSITDYNLADNNKLDYKNGWTPEVQLSVHEKCKEILNRKRWKYIVQGQMRSPHCENSQIIIALKYLEYTPMFDDFIPMLERDIYDNDIFDFMLSYHREIYVVSIIDYIGLVFPEEMFTQGPLDIKKDDMDYKFEPDVLLKYTLRAARYCNVYNEAFFIKCVSCRLPDCRTEAIYCLRNFESSWSENVKSIFEKAVVTEPVKSIKKQFLRLLHKPYDKEDAAQCYVDVQKKIIEPEPDDIFLLNTKISRIHCKDMSKVDEILEIGDLLCLIRVNTNKSDPKAIMVTTDDGYVLGYIPKDSTEMPAGFMDLGESLYGVLTEINLEKSELEMKLMLSKRKKVERSEKTKLRVIRGGK